MQAQFRGQAMIWWVYKQNLELPFVSLSFPHLLPSCCVACVPSGFSRVWFFVTTWTVTCQAPLSMQISRQEYWSGLPCPPPGGLSDAGIKLISLMSATLAGRFSTTSATWGTLPAAEVTPNPDLWLLNWKVCQHPFQVLPWPAHWGSKCGEHGTFMQCHSDTHPVSACFCLLPLYSSS